MDEPDAGNRQFLGVSLLLPFRSCAPDLRRFVPAETGQSLHHVDDAAPERDLLDLGERHDKGLAVPSAYKIEKSVGRPIAGSAFPSAGRPFTRRLPAHHVVADPGSSCGQIHSASVPSRRGRHTSGRHRHSDRLPGTNDVFALESACVQWRCVHPADHQFRAPQARAKL
jgi:hypothetical protein